MPTTSRAHRATAVDLAGLERHEVIAGEVVQKASSSGRHGRAQGRILMLLAGFEGPSGVGRSGRGGWWLGTELELELERHETYVPDIAGWRMERVPEPPEDKPVQVAPDWVCEVLSPSTAGRDLGYKRLVYHRHGVSHLWIADPQNLTLTVFRAGPGAYEVALVAEPGELVRAEPFDAIELAIADIFGRTG